MITHVSTVLNYLASVAGTRVNKNGDAVREGQRRAREAAFSSHLLFSLARHVSYACTCHAGSDQPLCWLTDLWFASGQENFVTYSFLPYSLQSNSSGTSTVLRTALMLLYDSWCSSRWTPPLWSVLLSSESPSFRKERRARDLNLQRELIPKISQNLPACQDQL